MRHTQAVPAQLCTWLSVCSSRRQWHPAPTCSAVLCLLEVPSSFAYQHSISQLNYARYIASGYASSSPPESVMGGIVSSIPVLVPARQTAIRDAVLAASKSSMTNRLGGCSTLPSSQMALQRQPTRAVRISPSAPPQHPHPPPLCPQPHSSIVF